MNGLTSSEAINMAQNDSEVMRVHVNFKKYVTQIKEKSRIPVVTITKKLAEDQPLVLMPKEKKR